MGMVGRDMKRGSAGGQSCVLRGTWRVRINRSSSASLPFTSPRRSFHVMLLLLLLLVLSAHTTRASVSGVTSWSSMDESIGDENTFFAPFFADGNITTYVEMVPATAELRLRNSSGTVYYRYAYEGFSSCGSPTGVTLFDGGPRVLIFCGESNFYLAVFLDENHVVLRVQRIDTTEIFFSSKAPHPSPLVVVRGESFESRNDLVLVVSTRGREFCFGMYGVKTQELKCQGNPITDLFLSTWVASTDAEPDPKTYFLVESHVSSNVELSSYYIPTFVSDVAPNATWSFVADVSSKVMRTNVNDHDSSTPLVAYVQSIMADTLKLMVSVINIDTLENVKSGAINIGASNVVPSGVTSAYMTVSDSTQLLLVQLTDLIVAINYNNLPEEVTPAWVVEVKTTTGLLFLPLRDLNANRGEWHRLQRSPSFTDYNPYHVIRATSFRAIVALANVSTYSLLDGTITSSYASAWSPMQFCGTGDRMVAITAFESSMAYLGCDATGQYELTDLSTGKSYYPITWPSVVRSPTDTFGYISEAGRITLVNRAETVGVDLHPLLLYSSSVRVNQKQESAGAYYRGRVAMVTANITSDDQMLFSYYVHEKFVVNGGLEPMAPVSAPIPLDKAEESGNSFVAFFGSGKRYIAVSTTPGILSIFSSTDGTRLPDVNLSSCVIDGEEEAAPVSFMKSVKHHGSRSNYYVVLGGSSTCLFEVNDTLIPRITLLQTARNGVVIGTTAYSGYTYTTSNLALQAFTSFFSEQSRSVYTEIGIDAYVVGSNVFVYVKGKTITCRSVRSDIIVWTQQLPNAYQGPVVHMTYYNNTVFLVDQRTIYRYNVQHHENEDTSSRVLFQTTLRDATATLSGAGVGQGIAVLYSTSGLYAYDAVTGEELWTTIPRTRKIPKGGNVEVLLYSHEDADDSGDLSKGPGYIEVRMRSTEERERQIVDVYSQESGAALTSASGTTNELQGPVIWGNNYVAFSSDVDGGMVSFRALNLSYVTLTEQSKRPLDPITDVFVPGEPPIIPLPPRLPRGDNLMSGAPPMIFSLSGDASLISGDRTRGIVGSISNNGENLQFDIKCVNVKNPNGEPIRAWNFLSGPSISPVKFVEYDTNYFIILTNARLQFFSWSTCVETGPSQVLTGFSNAVPSFISRPDANQWLFLGGERVTALQPSSGSMLWQTAVGNCRTIRLSSAYIICDGDEIYVLSAVNGEVLFYDSVVGCIAPAGYNFGGVVRKGNAYKAVFYSSSDKLFEWEISIPDISGDVVTAISGKSSTNVVVFFEYQAISLTFDPSAQRAAVIWSSDLNGESPERGAAGYVVENDAGIVVGTSNGIIILDAVTGKAFTNISLPRRFNKETKEVQMLGIVKVNNNGLYGFSWNGYAALVRCTRDTANALFAFGFGQIRQTQISAGGQFLVVSGGGTSGIVPLESVYWGAPFSMASLSSNEKGVFLAGWDQRNKVGVNLVTASPDGEGDNFLVQNEVDIKASFPTQGSFVVFLGAQSISMVNGVKASAMTTTMSSACAGATLRLVSPGDATGGYSIAWYGAPSRDCIFTIPQRAILPSLLDNFKAKYVGVTNVRYGSSFGLLTSGELISVSYSGAILATRALNNAVYFSSISSPDTGRGIFVVISQGNLVNCYQVDNLLPVWNYTLGAMSSAPVTYYNETIFVSSESGPYRLSLLEFSYPCPDRALFHVPRQRSAGRTTLHTQVVVNEEYAIAFVTTYQTFYAFHAFTGVVLWQRPELYGVKPVAVIRDGLLLVASNERNSVLFLDPFTGDTLLFFANLGNPNAEIFVHPDKQTVAFGGDMSTVINISNYAAIFSVVKPNLPKVQNLPPPYRPYNYAPTDSPNDCNVPNHKGLPITTTLGEEWISGPSYGLEGATQAVIALANQENFGWAASLKYPFLYIAYVVDGTFVQPHVIKIDEKDCTRLNLYLLSALRVFFAVGCKSKTLYYDRYGWLAGNVSHVARDEVSVVQKGSGYFINSDNYVDGVDLSSFVKLPKSSNSVECKGKYDLISLSKISVILLVCDGVGIVSIHPSTLEAKGAAITLGEKTKVNVLSFDVDEDLNVGIACGRNASHIHMVTFALSNMSIIMRHDEAAPEAPLCGIRYPGKPKSSEAFFALAFKNGFKTWRVAKGGAANKSENIPNFSPAAISNNGVLYMGTGYDFYFRGFDSSNSALVIEAQGPVAGHMLVRDLNTSKVTSSVIIYGDGFSFAVDTIQNIPRPLWGGNGFTQFDAAKRYTSGSPFVYTVAKDQSLIGLTVARVAFAAQGIFQMQTALVNREPRVFLSQSGTIGCLDSKGTILWNVGFTNPTGQMSVFSPVVLDTSDYLLASGGGRSVAIVNKHTGGVAKTLPLDTCRISPTPTESKIIVNGTFVFVALEGWSCVHIVDLNVVVTNGNPVVRAVKTLEVEGLPSGMNSDFPILANVGSGNHLVFAADTPDTDGRNHTFVVYRVDDLQSALWTRLWAASIRVDTGRTSTYGYFLYTVVGPALNVYDLLTGRYVWGYIFDADIAAPAVGADRSMHILTLTGVHSLRTNLNTPWSERQIGNRSLAQPISGSLRDVFGPLRTPYGLIVFSYSDRTLALEHSREAVQLKQSWISEKSIARLGVSYLTKTEAFGLFDSNSGTGLLDLTSGKMMWLAGIYPSNGLTNGVVFGDNLFVCSFVTDFPTCRNVSTDTLTPRRQMELYSYDPEPIETTPSDWTPIYPGGGGDKPLKPTPRCISLMHAFIPPFSNCVQLALDTIYPHGRSTALTCPSDLLHVYKCRAHLQGLADACLDVVTYMSEHWKRQTMDASLPLGLCNHSEVVVRCGTSNYTKIEETCLLASLEFTLNGYENPIGYSLEFPLKTFRFVSPPLKVNAGAIVGGVIGGALLLAIIAALVVRFIRRKKRSRDARFFDDDDIESNLLEKEKMVEPMVELRGGSLLPSSKESSIDLLRVGPRALPPKVLQEGADASADAAALAGPKKMPARMPLKMPSKVMAKKGFGPKMPPASSSASKPPGEKVIDVDDI